MLKRSWVPMYKSEYMLSNAVLSLDVLLLSEYMLSNAVLSLDVFLLSEYMLSNAVLSLDVFLLSEYMLSNAVLSLDVFLFRMECSRWRSWWRTFTRCRTRHTIASSPCQRGLRKHQPILRFDRTNPSSLLPSRYILLTAVLLLMQLCQGLPREE